MLLSVALKYRKAHALHGGVSIPGTGCPRKPEIQALYCFKKTIQNAGGCSFNTLHVALLTASSLKGILRYSPARHRDIWSS